MEKEAKFTIGTIFKRTENSPASIMEAIFKNRGTHA